MKAFLFPGLDALFVTSKMKRWLAHDFIRQDLSHASSVLSQLTQQNEDLASFLENTHRPHLVDFDRTLIALTTLQVSIAHALQRKNFSAHIIQGCSHGDIARSILCQSFDLKTAIEGLWSFSSLRKMLPNGLTSTVRTFSGQALTQAQIDWLESQNLPISFWSSFHGTIASEVTHMEAISLEAEKLDLKIRDMLPFPVHSPVLKPVFSLLKEVISQWSFQDPKLNTFSSVWLKELTTADDIRAEALASAVEPVRWTETLAYLYEHKGVREFINIGPSNTLTSWVLSDEKYKDLQVTEAWDLITEEAP